jgi:L-fuculose-phosphate aldolase
VEFEAERRAVAYFVRRIYRQRLTTATGGNISCRVGEDRLLLTCSGLDKARLKACQVALLDLEGGNLTPHLNPSSEWRIHLAIYQRHSEIRAVIHAHPTTASAFTCAETPIDLGLLCETYALLDPPVLAPYALSGTPELADIVADCAGRSSSILLQNHAVLTTGADLMQAFSRLELLEEAARMTLLARQLEGLRPLTREERTELDRLVGRPSQGPEQEHGRCLEA